MLGTSNVAPAGYRTHVGIVGLGYHTGAVADLCAEAGLRVGFAVDDREGQAGDPFGGASALVARGIPLLPAAAFARQVRHNPRLTLVAGRFEAATDSFVRAAEWVKRMGGATRPTHPSALLDRVPAAPCPERYAVFGHPGSGNVLTQHLIDGLFAGPPAPEPARWAVRASLAEHAFHSAAAAVRAALAPLAPAHVEFIPHEFGTMIVSVERGDGAAVAFGVPSDRHHGFRIFRTHSRPTRAALDHFHAAGVPCVAVVRHPCETLLSQANKIARPFRPVLDHPGFLDRAADRLAEWTAHLLVNRDRLHVVRYEDLAERRVSVLRRLAAHLGRPISDGEAEGLFANYLNRNLPANVPGHFYRGGNGKWRAAFTADDLRAVRARIPPQAFTAFGYPLPTAADLAPAAFTDPPVPHSALHAALLEMHECRPIPGTGIRVGGNNPELTAGLTAAFETPAVMDLLGLAVRRAA